MCILSFLLISCAPEVPDEELDAELQDLSDEELDQLLTEVEAADETAIAGQAFLRSRGYTVANKVPRNKLLAAAQKEKISRLEKDIAAKIIPIVKYTPVTNGLIGWWDGDDVSGNTAADVSINNNPGVLSNGAATASGKIGNAFSLDGSDDYVNIFFSSYVSKFTIEAWVKPDELIPYKNSVIISQHGSSMWELQVSTTTTEGINNLFFEYDNGNIHKRFLAGVVAGQEVERILPMVNTYIWRHIALTLDSDAGSAKFYINGVEIPIVNEASDTPAASGFQPVIRIGSSIDVSNDPTSPKSWDGLIDEVKLYNRVLSQAEIQSIYNYQPPQTTISGSSASPGNIVQSG